MWLTPILNIVLLRLNVGEYRVLEGVPIRGGRLKKRGVY